MWFEILKDKRFKDRVKAKYGDKEFEDWPSKVGPAAPNTTYQRKDKSGEYRRTGNAPVWEKYGIAQNLAVEMFRVAGWKRIKTGNGKGWLMEVTAPPTTSEAEYRPQIAIPLKRQKYKKMSHSQMLPRARRIKETSQGPREDEKYDKWWKKMKPQDRANWRESVVDSSVPPKFEERGTTDTESLTPTYSENEEDWIIMRQSGFIILDEDWKEIRRTDEDMGQFHLCLHPHFSPYDTQGKKVDYPDWIDSATRTVLSNVNKDQYGTLCIQTKRGGDSKPIADAYASLAHAITPENIKATFAEVGGMLGYESEDAKMDNPQHLDGYGIMMLTRSVCRDSYQTMTRDALLNNHDDRVMPTFPEKGRYQVIGTWLDLDGTGVEEE